MQHFANVKCCMMAQRHLPLHQNPLIDLDLIDGQRAAAGQRLCVIWVSLALNTVLLKVMLISGGYVKPQNKTSYSG